MLKKLKKSLIFAAIAFQNVRFALADYGEPGEFTFGDYEDPTNPANGLNGTVWWVGIGCNFAGLLAVIYGGYLLALSFSADEPADRNKAILFIGGALVLYLAPKILSALMAWQIISF